MDVHYDHSFIFGIMVWDNYMQIYTLIWSLCFMYSFDFYVIVDAAEIFRDIILMTMRVDAACCLNTWILDNCIAFEF